MYLSVIVLLAGLTPWNPLGEGGQRGDKRESVSVLGFISKNKRFSRIHCVESCNTYIINIIFVIS